MSWWRNDDPLDDENELEIKVLFLCVTIVSMIFLVVMFAGKI